MIAAVRVMQKENVVIPFLFIAVSLYKYMLCYLRLPPKACIWYRNGNELVYDSILSTVRLHRWLIIYFLGQHW